MSYLNSLVASPVGRGTFTALAAGCFVKACSSSRTLALRRGKRTLLQRTFSYCHRPLRSSDSLFKRQASEVALWATSGTLFALAALSAREDCQVPAPSFALRASAKNYFQSVEETTTITTWVCNQLCHWDKEALNGFGNWALQSAQAALNGLIDQAVKLGIPGASYVKEYPTLFFTSLAGAVISWTHFFGGDETSLLQSQNEGGAWGAPVEVDTQLHIGPLVVADPRFPRGGFPAPATVRVPTWYFVPPRAGGQRMNPTPSASEPFARPAPPKANTQAHPRSSQVVSVSSSDHTQMVPFAGAEELGLDGDSSLPRIHEVRLGEMTLYIRNVGGKFYFANQPEALVKLSGAPQVQEEGAAVSSAFRIADRSTTKQRRERLVSSAPKGPVMGPALPPKVNSQDFIMPSRLEAPSRDLGVGDVMQVRLSSLVPAEQLMRLDFAALERGIEIDLEGMRFLMRGLPGKKFVEISPLADLAQDTHVIEDQEEFIESPNLGMRSPSPGFESEDLSDDDSYAVNSQDFEFETPRKDLRAVFSDSSPVFESVLEGKMGKFDPLVAMSFEFMLEQDFCIESGELIESINHDLAESLFEFATISPRGEVLIDTKDGGQMPLSEIVAKTDLEPHLPRISAIIKTAIREHSQTAALTEMPPGPSPAPLQEEEVTPLRALLARLQAGTAELTDEEARELIREIDSGSSFLRVSKQMRTQGKRYIFTLKSPGSEDTHIPVTEAQTAQIDRLRAEAAKERRREENDQLEERASERNDHSASDLLQRPDSAGRPTTPGFGYQSLGADLLRAFSNTNTHDATRAGRVSDHFKGVQSFSGGVVTFLSKDGTPVSYNLDELDQSGRLSRAASRRAASRSSSVTSSPVPSLHFADTHSASTSPVPKHENDDQ